MNSTSSSNGTYDLFYDGTTNNLSSKLILTLLATSFAFSSNQNNVIEGEAYIAKGEAESTQLQISEGIEASQGVTKDFFTDISNRYKYNKADKVLENFIGKVLDKTERQPGELKSLMYDHIDDLLI